MWRLWCKAIGEKAVSNNTEADKIALIRTFLIFQAIITNLFIIANFILIHIYK